MSEMTTEQVQALRASQRATIDAALETERDPVKRAYWEQMRAKWEAGERGRAH